MKELHFIRTGRMHVATEGNYRFELWLMPIAKLWGANVRLRTSGKRVVADMRFASKSEAIDWLARYRQPMDEKVRAG